MKNLNKILIIGLVLLTILSLSITAFAFTRKFPAGIISDLTGKSIDDIADNSKKTYGQIIFDYDEELWEEFREEMLRNKIAIIEKRVEEGVLTSEEAKEIISNIEEMHQYCIENGGGYGMMKGTRRDDGYGMGQGYGMGNRFRNENSGFLGNGMGFGKGCRGSW